MKKNKRRFPQWMLDTLAIGARCGFISQQMWDECICKDVKRARSYERLATLRELGLLENAGEHFLRSKIFRLSESGKRVARSLGHKVFEEPGEMTLAEQEDAFLLSYGLAKLSFVKACFLKREINRSSNLLDLFNGRNLRGVLPDLIIELHVPGDRVFMAIELNADRHDPKAYWNFVRKYKELKNIHSVLILSRFRSLHEEIKWAQSCVEYTNDKRPMVFGDLGKFLKNPATAPIKSTEGTTNLEKSVQLIIEERIRTLKPQEFVEWKNKRCNYHSENGENSTELEPSKAS